MLEEPMPVDELSVLLGRLRAARKAKRLTQLEAAEHLGVSRTTLVAIEKGERSLRSQELIGLASLYGRSVNELLRPTPIPEGFVAQFRASPDKTLDDDQLESSVTLMQALADDYLEVERVAGAPLPQRYPPEASIRGIGPSEAAESLAASERNRLGLGDGPVLELRKLLEADVGLRIFALELPARVAGLFVHSSVHGGCIAVNAKHPFERQRWSLSHEYAHFLAHRSQSEVTLVGGHQRVPAAERFADAFAESFLMPAPGLMRRFHEVSQARADGVTPADLLHLADRFQVSFEAMVRRLENLGLVGRHTWDRLANAGFRVGEARQLLELASNPPDTEMLPLRFRYLAVDAWSRGEISEGQLARLLRVDRTSARELIARLSHGVGLDEEGAPSVVEVDSEQELDLIEA